MGKTCFSARGFSDLLIGLLIGKSRSFAPEMTMEEKSQRKGTILFMPRTRKDVVPDVQDDAGFEKFHLGLVVRARRREIHMTQKDLAQQLGVNQENISKYESGNYSFRADDIPKLARILHVAPDYFFDVNAFSPAVRRHSARSTPDWILPESWAVWASGASGDDKAVAVAEAEMVSHFRKLSPRQQRIAVALTQALVASEIAEQATTTESGEP